MYGTAAYFITGVAWDFLPMRVLPTAMFALVTYPMMGLRPGVCYAGRFLGVLVLTNLSGTAMSMAVGAHLTCSTAERYSPFFVHGCAWTLVHGCVL